MSSSHFAVTDFGILWWSFPATIITTMPWWRVPIFFYMYSLGFCWREERPLCPWSVASPYLVPGNSLGDWSRLIKTGDAFSMLEGQQSPRCQECRLLLASRLQTALTTVLIWVPRTAEPIRAFAKCSGPLQHGARGTDSPRKVANLCIPVDSFHTLLIASQLSITDHR